MSVYEICEQVTSLPYYDDEYNHPDVAEAVDALITAEMATFAPSSNYLAYLPSINNLGQNITELLANELSRIEQGIPQETFDFGRYKTVKLEKNRNIEAIKKNITLTEIFYEHKLNKVLNLELLLRFGKASWLSYIGQLEEISQGLSSKLESLQEEIRLVNLARMEEQTRAGAKMKELEEEWGDLLSKNLEIKQECSSLEEEVEFLKQQASERGIDLSGL